MDVWNRYGLTFGVRVCIGLRFVVKDIYAVKGIRTSGGSRSYYHTYGPSNYTASVVQKLLDGGATLVGMTKTIAFALGAPRSGDQVGMYAAVYHTSRSTIYMPRMKFR